MSKYSLYLDHAASTPCRPEVLEAMAPCFLANAGNPASIHSAGRRAKAALEDARARVAGQLGATPREIVFTASATESIDLALRGVVAARRDAGGHLVTSNAEHHAVLHTCHALAREGLEMTVLPVNRFGCLQSDQVAAAIRPDTILCSIMHANNEVGTITPVEEIARAVKEQNPRCLVHTDATASIGHLQLDLGQSHVDLASFSAHKFYGPKGIGGLYVRQGTPLLPRLLGGGQERNLRSGTPAVPLAVGMAVALEMACAEIDSEKACWSPLRDALTRALTATVPHCHLNGHPTDRLPTHVNLSFLGVSGEDLVLRLDLLGVCASTGSACTTGSVEPSHVLTAMGLPHPWALGSLRLTLGHGCRDMAVEPLVAEIARIVAQLRSTSGYRSPWQVRPPPQGMTMVKDDPQVTM